MVTASFARHGSATLEWAARFCERLASPVESQPFVLAAHSRADTSHRPNYNAARSIGLYEVLTMEAWHVPGYGGECGSEPV
jgi:hypothetical protein